MVGYPYNPNLDNHLDNLNVDNLNLNLDNHSQAGVRVCLIGESRSCPVDSKLTSHVHPLSTWDPNNMVFK